ncbi:MAG: hypothetical protein A3G93_04225 [Nitrospinae bacterium RIFCSPLOWO2_12_FULL_45_22]|nr:MAG: hypothetical protein A3G93_04225 [Nitrospinae bacterium RIFCSPLOWO2_12_FULL_45_22]
MCKSLQECIELFEIKPFAKKLIAYCQLRSIEKEIKKQIDEKEFANNPHQAWEVRIKGILSKDLFGQEEGSAITDWKNKVKVDSVGNIKEGDLLTLKNMVTGIKSSVNPLVPFLIFLMILGLIASLLFLFGKYFSFNITFGGQIKAPNKLIQVTPKSSAPD